MKRSALAVAIAAIAVVAASSDARADSFFEPRHRNLGDAGIDALALGGELGLGCLTVELLSPGFFRTWSPNRVALNFADPIGRANLGFTLDRDPKLFNDLAHGIGWSLQALYLMERGNGWLATLAWTFATNVLWEFVLEGGRGPPSGKDLADDLEWSIIGILIAVVAAEGERAAPHSALGRIVRWLNPFHALHLAGVGR